MFKDWLCRRMGSTFSRQRSLVNLSILINWSKKDMVSHCVKLAAFGLAILSFAAQYSQAFSSTNSLVLQRYHSISTCLQRVEIRRPMSFRNRASSSCMLTSIVCQQGGATTHLDSKLLKAIQGKNSLEVNNLLQQGANPNSFDDWGVSLLQLATKLGEVGIVSALLDKGADVNRSDVDGDATSPLHAAAQAGFLELVQILVRNGADVDRLDAFGCTAKDVASAAKKQSIVSFLQPLETKAPKVTPSDVKGIDMNGNKLTKAEAEALLEESADWEAAERGEEGGGGSVVQIVTDPVSGKQTMRRIPLKSDYIKGLERSRRSSL